MLLIKLAIIGTQQDQNTILDKELVTVLVSGGRMLIEKDLSSGIIILTGKAMCSFSQNMRIKISHYTVPMDVTVLTSLDCIGTKNYCEL